MKAEVHVEAGVCGFVTDVTAGSEDGQHVDLSVETGCRNIRALADALQAGGPVDAFEEMGKGSDGRVLSTARLHLRGCCAACGALVGIFKGVQVAARLNLPSDITIRMKVEE